MREIRRCIPRLFPIQGHDRRLLWLLAVVEVFAVLPYPTHRVCGDQLPIYKSEDVVELGGLIVHICKISA